MFKMFACGKNSRAIFGKVLGVPVKRHPKREPGCAACAQPRSFTIQHHRKEIDAEFLRVR